MSEEAAQAAGDRAWAVRLTQENAELRSLASRLNEQLRIADAEIATYAERADKAETELAAAQAIIAGLRRSLAAANERAEQAEAKVAGLNLAADQYSVSRDAWMIKAEAAEERAEQAEMERKAWTEIGAKAQADAGALRACLADTLGFAWQIHRVEQQKLSVDVRQRANELIVAEHPGAALLTELEAARDLAETVRDWRTGPTTGGELTAALERYDAAMDAIRKEKGK